MKMERIKALADEIGRSCVVFTDTESGKHDASVKAADLLRLAKEAEAKQRKDAAESEFGKAKKLCSDLATDARNMTACILDIFAGRVEWRGDNAKVACSSKQSHFGYKLMSDSGVCEYNRIATLCSKLKDAFIDMSSLAAIVNPILDEKKAKHYDPSQAKGATASPPALLALKNLNNAWVLFEGMVKARQPKKQEVPLAQAA